MSKSVLPAEEPIGVGSPPDKEVNNVEVINVSSEGGDQVWSHNKEDVWHSDVHETLPPACTVKLCGFVKFSWNVLQNTSDLHDGVRNTNPKVDENNRNPCPSSILKNGSGE